MPTGPCAARAARLASLTRQALQLRLRGRYAVHPLETLLAHYRARFGAGGAQSDDGLGFESAEGIYRGGAQGLPLSALPKLPESVLELGRLRECDAAGRRRLRDWAEAGGHLLNDAAFEAA